MNSEKLCNLTNNIIENEYRHVQEFKEVEAMDNNKNWLRSNEKYIELFNEIKEALPEELKCKMVELDDLMNEDRTYAERYYFKEGLLAALTNLKFLNDIDNIGCLI